jgi:hypothetical protein
MTQVAPQPAKPRRGCLFYGCITGAGLLVLALCLLLLAVHYVHNLVNRFTDTQPMTLPTVQMSPADLDKLKQRVDSFGQAVRNQRATPPLVLNSEDINALIASGHERESWKGKLYVTIQSNQLKGEVSVPLQQIGLSMFKGRYLNGSGTFNLSFTNGLLAVTPQEIWAKGKPLPGMYMDQIRQDNLAAAFTNQPGAAAVLKGIQDIKVNDDQLVIVPKEKP